ncbi:MAG: hypothetical protein J0H94_21535 [Rhizobiales bacterium]|nr:hypothetical protein [Hyphomicrobiales bacterium]
MTTGQDELGPDARETTRYIQQFSKELRGLAQKANLVFLAFLLSMAEDEANATLRRMGEPGSDRA